MSRSPVRLVFALALLPLIATNACSGSKSAAPPDETGGEGSDTGGSGGKATGGSGGGKATGGAGGASTGGSGGVTATGGMGGQATGGSSGTGGAPATGGMSGGPDGGTPPGDASTGGDQPKFSFFVTSFAGLRRLSGNEKGFGGNLKYGQASGLAGADKICTELAENAMPGSGAKGWRAFLSAAKGLTGAPEHAIDRIGEGPWYDRKGRILAMNKAALLNPRPLGADPTIINDFPNEFGINNSTPNPGGPKEDNHHFLTGSNSMGMLDGERTCQSWETNETTATNPPRTGFSYVISNRRHWYYGQVEGGCGAGYDIDGSGPANPSIHHVGSGGGYGGFYCFALKP